MAVRHEQVAPEHEQDGDEQGDAVADSKQRQNEQQQEGERAAEDHLEGMAHWAFSFSGLGET